MKLSRHVYTSLLEKIVHAVLGFILFLALNFVSLLLYLRLFWELYAPPANGQAAYGLTFLLLNIGLLIYFGFTRYWIALGALVVCAIWFVIVLLMAPGCFGLDPSFLNDSNGWPSMAG
jgi:hypothetical protein